MKKYSLKLESEVILSRPLHSNPLLQADKGDVCNNIKILYELLVNKYRDLFFMD